MSKYGEMKLMDLMEFDVKSKEKFNAQREVGTKTRSLLKELDSLEKKKFEDITSFYMCSVSTREAAT